jgi:hypothetical protein
MSGNSERTDYVKYEEVDGLYNAKIINFTKDAVKKVLEYFDQPTTAALAAPAEGTAPTAETVAPKTITAITDQATGEALYCMYDYCGMKIPTHVHEGAGNRVPKMPRRSLYSNTPICDKKGECTAFAYFRDLQTRFLSGKVGAQTTEEARKSDRDIFDKIRGAKKRKIEGEDEDEDKMTEEEMANRIEVLVKSVEDAQEVAKNQAELVRAAEYQKEMAVGLKSNMDKTVEALESSNNALKVNIAMKDNVMKRQEQEISSMRDMIKDLKQSEKLLRNKVSDLQKEKQTAAANIRDTPEQPPLRRRQQQDQT